MRKDHEVQQSLENWQFLLEESFIVSKPLRISKDYMKGRIEALQWVLAEMKVN